MRPSRWEPQDTSRLKALSARLQSEPFPSWPTPDRFDTYDLLHRASVALAAFAALTQEHEKLKQAHETLMFRLEANTNAGFSLPAVEAALAALKDQKATTPPVFMCPVCDQTPERGHAPDCPGAKESAT